MAIERRTDWPDVFSRRLGEWFDWPMFGAMREAEHMLRVEEYEEEDALVVRAEMPGIDPDKDVQIQVRDHSLEIRAERRQEETREEKGARHSEFRYGSFYRMLTMPPNAKESEVAATYQDGILEIRVPLERRGEEGPKAIPVQRR